jgi:hypothetical protein
VDMRSIIIDRLVRRRGAEIAITTVLLLIVFAALLWAQVLTNHFAQQLSEKIAFAFLVAIVVRWVTIGFSEVELLEQSSRVELYEAIDDATDRIWICQTWLPGTEVDALRIVQSRAAEVKLLLASFKSESPIFARISGRGISVPDAKVLVNRSVAPFVQASSERVTIRFNYGHYPGWIAVVDSVVFWGPTPVHVDNWANDFLFHRSSIHGKKGAFWMNQFQILWGTKHSHTYEDEKQEHNTTLP